MRNRLLIILIMLVISMISHAQVAEYYFTQQNLTYTEITGGTVLWSGTLADEVSGAITIPSFTFNGTAYTSIYVSANGFITFGIAPVGTNYLPISTSTGYAGAVSAFGRNLVHAATGSPAVRYEQVGNEFVIQWKDVRRTAVASEIISFQVRLNTSNNYISVIYGGTITPGSNISYPQVGLRGASNTDYNNRIIASGGGNWINSATGTANTSAMYFNSANSGTVPSSGLTFSWKPLYNPTSFVAVANGFDQIDLSWVKNSLNHNVVLAYTTDNVFGTPDSETAYPAESTIPGGGTVLYNGSGTSFSHEDINPSTTYYYKIWSYDAVPDYSSGVTADIFIAYPLPYLQDFNAASTLPIRWSSDMSISTTTPHGTAGSRGLYKRLYSGVTTSYAITPLIGDIATNTNLSFHYRIVEYDEYPLVATQLGSGDKIDIQVSLDDGANFTTFHTIDQNNHTAATEFTNKVLSLSAYDGDLVKVRFLCTWGSGDYYVDIDNVLFEDGTNMSYSGSTTEQPNTTNVGIGSFDNDIIRLQVITQKSSSPLSVTSITFNTTGSTSATNDIAAAKVYFTTGPIFSTAAQFGTTYNNPPGTGTFSITGTQALAQGNNYLWLAYDIKSTAAANNVVDGQCTQFIISGSSNTPTNQNPDGNRPIVEVFTGTKTIPGDYATIALAVTALNNGVVGSGGVTFNVAAGHTETSANITLNATGTSANQIIFQKSGEGANPLITAAAGTSTTYDGIIKIAGGDYITFDGIDMLDPTTNTTSTTRMEWGYALVKQQNSIPYNGCQFVTIKNCTITLQKIYASSVGIYAGNHIATVTTALTLVAPTDAMNNCKFFSNTITNVYTGIKLSGYNDASPYTLFNQDNEIGVSGGNMITNFGGLSSAAYGIYTIYEAGIKVANNEITGGTATTTTLSGMLISTATSANIDIFENTVTLTGGATTSAITGISNAAGSTAAGNAINIYNNDIINCTYPTATSGAFTAIANTATAATVNIYGNEISTNTLPGSGLFTGIDGGGPANLNIYQNTINGNQKTGTSGNFIVITNAAISTVNVYGNEIATNTQAGTGNFTGIDGGSPANLNIYENTINGNQKTGAYGIMYLTKAGISIIDFHSNDIYDNSIPGSSGSGASQIYGYYNDVAATVENLHDNNIYNLVVSGSSSSASTKIIGIYTNTVASATKIIFQNNIYGFSVPIGPVHGISQTLGTTVSIYKNDIYDLSTSSASGINGLVSGILINSGTSVYVYNNFISDLKTPLANNADAIRGISIVSSQTNSTIGVYYNTIYLNASSSGTSFGTSGLFHIGSSTATTAALDLRNNIIINNSSQNGTSYNTVAFRRNSSNLNNYLNTSDNNIYYAGVPGSHHLVYYNADTSFQTMDSLRSYMGPSRDSLSFSEIPPFINTTTTPYNLRLQDGATTHCESGAMPVTSPVSITDDFDGATRLSTPDIGADEFSGISAYVEAPLAFTASSYNSQQIKLDFEGNSYDDEIVIVFNFTGIFTDPSGTPVEGQPLAGGTVLYVGTVSPFIHTGLTPGTRIYYQVFSYSGSSYSNGLSANTIPAVLPVTDLSATETSQTQIDLAWTKNASDHSVMVAVNSTSTMGTPVNGTSYNVGNTITGGGTVIYKGPAGGYNHTGLTQWSQYYYRVWSYDSYNYYSVFTAKNAITDSDPVTVPYLQNFDGTWGLSPAAPPAWNVIDVGGNGSNTWVRYITSPHSAPASARGYEDLDADDYLISPPLVLPDTLLQMSWWDITTNASLNSYKVLLSTTNKAISSFTIELDDIDCTHNTWEKHTIDLNDYKGQTVYIAFYQDYSTTSGEYFRIDDIFFETLLPGVASLVAPADELLTMVNPTLKWNAPLSSFPILGYKVYQGTGPNPATLIYDGPAQTFQMEDLDHNTPYYWKVVPYNSYGEAMNVPVWSFTTVTSTQLAESFEADNFPPVGWSWEYGWDNDIAESYHGNQAARHFTWNEASLRPLLITPLLEIEAGDKLEFFERATSKYNNFWLIYYSTDKEDWTALNSANYFTIGAWGHQIIDLTALAGNNYYLAFQAWCASSSNDYVYIDHVTGPDVVPILPAPATDPDPYESASFVSTTPTLSWAPGIYGGIPTGFKVYMDTDTNTTTLIYNGPDPFYQTGTLLHDTTYYWKVVPHNTAGDATDCPVWSFTVIPELALQIGTGTSAFPSLPISVSVDYSYTQTLYLQPEIDISANRISKIYYEFSGGGGGPTFKDWVIYMGHTDKSSFNAITDWIPFEGLTQVYNGEVIISGENGWYEITLDVPFEYNNSENLVIAVDENTPGAASAESCYFYGTDTSVVRALVYEDYSVNPDPESPPAAGAQVSGFANIRMQLEGIPTVPVFRVNPTSKDYGYVVLENESSPQTFTIRNNGVGILTINSVALTGTDDDQFQLTNTNTFPTDLAAYESITVSVTFHPTTEGPKSATLAIAHNLTGSPAQLPLSGIGLDPVIDDFPFSETFEDDSPFRVLWTQIQEYGTGPWTYDAGADYYGNINTAHGGMLNARFTSSPDGNITKLVSPVFDLTGLTDPHVTFWYGQEYMDPSQNELKVYYRTASDQSWAQIFWDNEDKSEWTPQALELPNPTKTYQLAFEGIDNYGFANVLDDVTVGPPPEPVFSVNPTLKDFGYVLLDSLSSPQTFTIINDWFGMLTIDEVALTGTDAGLFALTDLNLYPMELAFHESIVVSVTFHTTTEGAKTAALEITDNASGSPHHVPLSGVGFDPIIDDFPFTETFEDNSFSRDLWTQIQEYGTGLWTFATGAGDGSISTAHGGLLNARFTSSEDGNITKLVSPIFDLTGVTNPQVVFWYGQEVWTGDQNELIVYYRTAVDQPWEEIFWDNTDRSEWTSDTLSLPNKSATYQIAFEGIDHYGYANVMDDVTVRPAAGPTTTWIGDISSDWTDPDNWSDGVPGVNHIVIISAGVYEPLIETDVTIYKITVETGVNVTINPGIILTVTGK